MLRALRVELRDQIAHAEPRVDGVAPGRLGEGLLRRLERAEQVLDVVEVLVEQNYKGYTPHFTPVDLMFDAPIGSIVNADVIAINKEKGRLVADTVA